MSSAAPPSATAATSRIILIELPTPLQDEVAQLLKNAGFEVMSSTALFEQLQSFRPSVVLLNLAPVSLSCCDVLSSLRANQATKEIRVIALVKGDAEARARALDLGANVAVPESVHPAELLAQVRLQLREAEQVVRLERELDRAEEHEHELQDQVRQTVPLKRLLILGFTLLGCLLVLSAIVFLAISLSSRRQTIQVRKTLATLQGSVLQQQESLARVQHEREELQRAYGQATDDRAHLVAERDQLAKQATNSAANSTLLEQLRNAEGRLQKLEVGRDASRRIVEQYAPSVALLHVVVSFRHIETGKTVTIAKNSPGENPGALTVELEGDGPPLQLDFFGTGFVAGKDGLLITNHHVAEPWWQNEEIQPLLDRGVKPVITSMEAFFPGVTTALKASIVQISQTADVSTVRVANVPRSLRMLPLASKADAANSGDPIILIGYPTGIAGILARVDEKTATELMSNLRDPQTLLTELAKRRLIRPISTQGHIGDVRPDQLVYDAQTTSGGSGGPVFDLNGKVVGVNYAVLNGFSGASFAVPVRSARQLIGMPLGSRQERSK